jgi:Uma2 family endonuclease
MEVIEIHTESLNLTEEQFFLLCVRNKELRIERDSHQNIIIMSPTGARTGNYNIKLAQAFENWNEKKNLGISFDSNAGFTLPNNAMRSPDLSWITLEKWNKISNYEQDRFPHICPDFVIEVKSKSDTLKQQKEKMEEWIENGCRLGWLIDPDSRTTFVYKPNMKPSEIPFNEILSGEDVLAGFELLVGKIILD